MTGNTTMKYALVLDIDETLLNPLEKYKTILNKTLGTQITIKDIEVNGGLDNLFRTFPFYDKFCEIADKLRESSEFNSELPTIEGSVEYLRKIMSFPSLVHLLYLTTRPVNITLPTIDNLLNAGFPDADIIARPLDIHRDNTAHWKKSILAEFSQDFDGEVIFVDDNISTANQIYSKNLEDPQSKIHMILFSGPITYTQIAMENISSDYKNYFYVANNWMHIFQLCKEIIFGNRGDEIE